MVTDVRQSMFNDILYDIGASTILRMEIGKSKYCTCCGKVKQGQARSARENITNLELLAVLTRWWRCYTSRRGKPVQICFVTVRLSLVLSSSQILQIGRTETCTCMQQQCSFEHIPLSVNDGRYSEMNVCKTNSVKTKSLKFMEG